MHNKKILMAIFVVVAIAASGAWWFLNQPDETNANRLLLYGNIDIREAELAFNNSEHIKALLVQEGDHVQKDQLLATLHDDRCRAEVAVAEAMVASRQASLARLQAGSRPEEISKAKADVSAARAGW